MKFLLNKNGRINLSFTHVRNVYLGVLKQGGTITSCERWSRDTEMFEVKIVGNTQSDFIWSSVILRPNDE